MYLCRIWSFSTSISLDLLSVLGSHKLAEDWCHFCFASLFLCGSKSGGSWHSPSCHGSGMGAGAGCCWAVGAGGAAQGCSWHRRWVTTCSCFLCSPADRTSHPGLGCSDVHPSWTQVEVGAAIADTSPGALQTREKVTAGFINVQCGSVSYFLKFLFKEEISLSYFPI